jgi:hypothetical protein
MRSMPSRLPDFGQVMQVEEVSKHKASSDEKYQEYKTLAIDIVKRSGVHLSPEDFWISVGYLIREAELKA